MMLSTHVRPRVGAVSLLCGALFTGYSGLSAMADGSTANSGAGIVAHLSGDSAMQTAAKKLDEAATLRPSGRQSCVGVTNPTPFPINLRIGALLSPKGKLDIGADLTLPDLHILPSLTTRIDADAIFGANIGGSQTIIPVTFDQLYTKSLPGTTSFYFGGGAGLYLGGRSRFGGKAVVGATFNRFGVEADLHFSGSGDPLLSLQGRIAI